MKLGAIHVVISEPTLSAASQQLAEQMISLVIAELGQNPVGSIAIYGQTPECVLCAQCCGDWQALSLVEDYFATRKIRFSCCYAAHFVSVIYQIADSLQYRICLRPI
ncbi:MAG: hypothetical protein C3F02_02450 [Parcubacteria group bacterium]|nr:MAG: hypothetical protein C3F02_02450 [Parcubacteria group bacterium]